MITVLKCLKNLIISPPSNYLAKPRYLFHLSFPHKLIPPTTCLFLLLSLNSLQLAEIFWHRGACNHKQYLWCGLLYTTQTGAIFSLVHGIVPLHVHPKFTLAFFVAAFLCKLLYNLLSGVTLRDFGWIPPLLNIWVSGYFSPRFNSMHIFQIGLHFLISCPSF